MGRKTTEEKTQRKRELSDYRLRLQAAGWVRLNGWISPELRQYLKANRRKGDCYGRLLERLILGAPTKRLWNDRLDPR